MLNNFQKLWDVLSKPGIEEKKIQTLLIGEVLQSLPAKLSSKISGYPGRKKRNDIQTDLQAVSDLVIEDLVNLRNLEVRFLEECYCKSGALAQHSLLTKAILQARYSAIFDSQAPGPNISPAVDRDGISPELLAQSVSRRPILLIGDVGVGKTTFVRNLIKVEAATLFQNAIYIYINLGAQATTSSDIRTYVPEEIKRQLRETYYVDVDELNFIRAVYHGELEHFAKGLYGAYRYTNPQLYIQKEIEFLEVKVSDKVQYLKKAFEHVVKGRKQQVVIFLDNADQRSDETQQQAFLIAQEIADSWPATVFISLRPETFHSSMKRGALSGYHPRAFTISPPRIDLVIEKRLNFALKLTSGEIPINSLPSNTLVQFTKLDAIIRSFLYSLSYNDRLSEFLDNMSNGNVRMALDQVKSFFGSGHVDTRKIVDIYTQTQSYLIPLHEFLRAIIYVDYEYFYPEHQQSLITNIFDVSYSDSKEHFLLPIIIGLLSSPIGPGSEDGFLAIEKVYEKVQGLGFTPEQIDSAIIRGHKNNLIETGARRIPQPGQAMPYSLRATSVGVYHINRLCHLFAYTDAIVVDTPIFDTSKRREILDVSLIVDRLNRAEIFRQYLDVEWKRFENINQTKFFDWELVSRALRSDISFVKRKATGN